jgi:hypothetical protein
MHKQIQQSNFATSKETGCNPKLQAERSSEISNFAAFALGPQYRSLV